MMELIKLAHNAHVLAKDNTYYLFSYELCLAQYDRNLNNLFIRKDWDTYSNTTNKHLYQFLREYTCYGFYNKKDLMRLINDPKVNVNVVEEI